MVGSVSPEVDTVKLRVLYTQPIDCRVQLSSECRYKKDRGCRALTAATFRAASSTKVASCRSTMKFFTLQGTVDT